VVQEKASTEKCKKEFYDSDMGRLVKRHTDSHPAMAEVVNRAAKSCGLDRLVKKTGSGAGLEKARRLRCVACAWHATQQQATHDGLQRARCKWHRPTADRKSKCADYVRASIQAASNLGFSS
jgi:hypothetical protein